MSLSRREETLARHPGRQALDFSVERLAAELRTQCPELAFAYLLGSARDGHVAPGADVDLAVYFADQAPADWARVDRIAAVVEAVVPGTECDLGILNEAGPVFRFEALQGIRLFVQDNGWEAYTTFYSLTCREYEDWICRRTVRYSTSRHQMTSV